MRQLVCLFVFFAVSLIQTGCEVLINPTAEIKVIKNNTEILSSSEFDFGVMFVGESSPKVTYTIESIGNTKLTLSGTPDIISISGNTLDFAIEQSNILASLEPGDSTEFSISFVPTSEGMKQATIKIDNNDLDENPITIVVKGKGVKPEINVKQGAKDIPIGSLGFDFGELEVGETSQEITFTIENNGSGNLKLTNSTNLIAVIGDDASMFTINQTNTKSIISPGETTEFSISFLPSSIWVKSATVSIANSDIDENPYTFEVKGEGITAPEINVRQGAIDIPSGTGIYDFGDILLNESTLNIEFTIENLGTIDLELNNSPDLVNISGTNSIMFNLNDSGTTTPISSGTTTYFTISFNPTNIGVMKARISIYCNDYDENPYTFIIKGTGVAPEINVKQGNNDIPSGTGSYDFGLLPTNNSTKKVTFTIENLGTSLLQLTGTPDLIQIYGSDVTEFIVESTSTSSNINPGNKTTFSITFKPTKTGMVSATVSIANTDTDENPYTFTITGQFYVLGDINGDKIPDLVVGAWGNDYGGKDAGCVYVFFGNTISGSPMYASNANIKIYGSSYDNLGLTIKVKDINADYLDDIIIGNAYSDKGGTDSGCVSIFYGKRNWPALINIADADIILIGEREKDCFGIDVSFGDLNKDGLIDIIVGAYHDNEIADRAGSAYIFFGRTSWASQIDASTANVKLFGTSQYDFFGLCVSCVGDINKDSIDDLMIGAYQSGNIKQGQAYIFFGKSNWRTVINASNADVILVGPENQSDFGIHLSSGDINKDGLNDLLISAPYSSINGDNTGSAYVFYGRQNWSAKYTTSNANIKIIGDSIGMSLGSHTSLIDINDDGYDDIMLGTYSWDHNKKSNVYIIFGANKLFSTYYTSTVDVVLTGNNANDFFGYLFSTKDLNNDGIKDLIVSAYCDDENGLDSGCANIFYGRKNWNSTYTASDAKIRILGENAEDYFGCGIANSK